MKIRSTLPNGRNLFLWNDESITHLARFEGENCELHSTFHSIFTALAAFCTLTERDLQKRDALYERLTEAAVAEGYDEESGKKNTVTTVSQKINGAVSALLMLDTDNFSSEDKKAFETLREAARILNEFIEESNPNEE